MNKVATALMPIAVSIGLLTMSAIAVALVESNTALEAHKMILIIVGLLIAQPILLLLVSIPIHYLIKQTSPNTAPIYKKSVIGVTTALALLVTIIILSGFLL